jgi:hypothetical protein
MADGWGHARGERDAHRALCAVDKVVFWTVVVVIVECGVEPAEACACAAGAAATSGATGDGAGVGGGAGADSGAIAATECGDARVQCGATDTTPDRLEQKNWIVEMIRNIRLGLPRLVI